MPKKLGRVKIEWATRRQGRSWTVTVIGLVPEDQIDALIKHWRHGTDMIKSIRRGKT